MPSTPLSATPGNSYCGPQAPSITLTAAHRDSLTKPTHTTILHHSSRTMFSTKSVQRPSAPRSWFSKPDTPKPAKPKMLPIVQQPVMMPLSPPTIGGPPPPNPTVMMPPRVVGHRPAVATPPLRSPRPAAQAPAKTVGPKLQYPPTPGLSPQNGYQTGPTSPRYQAVKTEEKFDGWMATFCVEPADDCDACCLSYWVPCAQFGKTHWRLKQIEDGQDPSDKSWSPGLGCNGSCWMWSGLAVATGCDCILTGFQRTRIRATYGIDGNIGNDLCLAYWCKPCTLVQMDREVRARHGEMGLRTNPKAPFIDDQPSQMADMRYVSPRATVSDNSQARPQNIRSDSSGGACDGADGGVLQNSQNQKSKSPNFKLDKSKAEKFKPAKAKFEESKSEKSKTENSLKSSQPASAHVEMSPIDSSSQKVSNTIIRARDSYFSSHDIPLLRSDKNAHEGRNASVKKSEITPKGSHDENKKAVKKSSSSTSSHDLNHCSPEPILEEAHAKKNVESSKGAESASDTKGKARELQPRQQAEVKNITKDRESSEQTATDSGSVLVGSSDRKTSKKGAVNTTDTQEGSYVHDFTDCPVDKNILDYYEKEEKRSQASKQQQHALEDCGRISPSSTHYLNTFDQHTLEDCPEKDTSIKTKSAGAQSHTLAEDPTESDSNGKAKSHELKPHNLSDDSEEQSNSSKTKPSGLQTHTLVNDFTEKVNKAKPLLLQPHTLADCPEKDRNKAKLAHSQPHDLVDCEATKHRSDVKPSGPQPHALADCAHESVNISSVEQHALADCHGDGTKQSRRASSDPESPTDRHAQVKQRRLASCPAPAHNQKDGKAKTSHHVAENARINESGDSQSTMKPTTQHTLSDCMGGAKLERQTSAVDDHPRTERHGSLNSLRDYFKGKIDAADHPQKSRYYKEVDDAANTSGAKRTTHAQQSLSQILGGSGVKKAKSRDDPVETIKGATHSVGDRIKKRSDSIGDAFRKQTDKVGQDVKKGTETVGDEVKKQTDKIAGKEEHKSSGGGFSNMMLSKMSPKSKAN